MCDLRFGPATWFTSGPLLVATKGTTGPTGSVTSTATLGPINTSGQELFTAGNVSSTCTASESGASGSTAIVGGVVQTSQGDPDAEGDETFVTVDPNPDPNTVVEGQI